MGEGEQFTSAEFVFLSRKHDLSKSPTIKILCTPDWSEIGCVLARIGGIRQSNLAKDFIRDERGEKRNLGRRNGLP